MRRVPYLVCLICIGLVECAFSPDPLEDFIQTVHPRVVERAVRRRRASGDVYMQEPSKLKVIEVGDWTLELNPESNLVVAERLRAEWVAANGDVTLKALQRCDYKLGVVGGVRAASKVAVALCEGGAVQGYFDVDGFVFFLQPVDQNGAHLLFSKKRNKRFLEETYKNPAPSMWLFNLTGDTIDVPEDLDDDAEIPERYPEDNTTEAHRARPRDQSDVDEVGYFQDIAWTANSPISRKPGGSAPKMEMKWLEIAIAVDHTVIGFHGRDKVEPYILALMNIVNAIYQDSSLEANIRLVVTRLLLYEHKRQSMVRPGDAKRSLENVNSWNQRLHAGLSEGEPRHDVAVWLTRSDIGGPSGYAPVAGTCDPKRSCALNRDEGLTSAFIIAHEMAHILGLSHDGDRNHTNTCAEESSRGSVMAPLVAATFHQFSWSRCSRNEFQKMIRKWQCLSNPPADGSREIVLNATLQNAFSMDDQCRMEFGEGYGLCTAFDIIEPCSHLWCGHVKSPLVCKTKKGSPLEGTECGFNKWCWNGYCEERRRGGGNSGPVMRNPQDGAWSGWGPWGPCSRSCGTGAQFRTRKCNNPTPLHGGSDCIGVAEKWRVCKKQTCPEPLGDMRAQQCRRLSALLDLAGSREGNMTWLPYESDEPEKKCKLICISESSRELFESSENLIDGTPCSYENSDNICIQGICEILGCDGQLSSNITTDMCGVCGGNNSNCSEVQKITRRKIKKEVTRVAVLPRMATKIRVEANVSAHAGNDSAVAFILKNRRKKRYSITVPNNGLRTEIIEGTKFYYRQVLDKHMIWAKGPVLAEMVILVYAPISEIKKGLNVSLRSEYIINKGAVNSSNGHKWVLGGWGSCSASCGGGRRQKTVACWDEQNQKLVRRKHCSLMTKPSLQSETCNTFECQFQWVPGEWEPCSTTCGWHGVQHRELYCVPQGILNSLHNSTLVHPWKYMVNPNKCSGAAPRESMPCNRVPCHSFWTYGDWSQCSQTCGAGYSFRSSYCPLPDGEPFYTCGGDAPPATQKRVCYGGTRYTNPACRGRNKKPCTEDRSEYCSLQVLSKYCKLGGFRRLCCKSCQNQSQIVLKI